MKVKVNTEIKFIISLIFSILVAVFAIQNSGNVEVRFFLAQFTISQAVVILVSAIVGAIIVLLLGLIKQIKQNMKIKQLSKEVNNLTNEKDELEAKLEAKLEEIDLVYEEKNGAEEKIECDSSI